jgi:hypothetical protein
MAAASSMLSMVLKVAPAARLDSEQLDLSQGRSPRLASQSPAQLGHTIKETEGARHERHDFEGGSGLDAVFGHRLGDGLLNRDYRARTSVGKRSGVRPRVGDRVNHRTHARGLLRRMSPLVADFVAKVVDAPGEY